MRVRLEPRATSPREILNELLSPFGLSAGDGPGGRILIVRNSHTNPGATETVARPTRSLRCTVVLLCPSAVFAQASIAGVVRDSSGGVLPRVTVEAASPALIEEVRTAVTDGGPASHRRSWRGTYAVTFALVD